MASVFMRGGRWYLRYKNERGVWRSVASRAVTKTEAKRLASDLERRAERQRLGLEPLPPTDGGGTLGELLAWWLQTYSLGTPSHDKNKSAIEHNLIGSELASLRLTEVTPGCIELYLQGRSSELGPQTLNHLRRYIVTAFNKAKLAGRWPGDNPALGVPRRTIPKRIHDFLRVHEVPLVLAVLSKRHRWLFATAIYTGMRKCELLGLRKTDVDFHTGLISVCRSYDRDTTKGKVAAAIPIASELVPYLKAAIEASPSDLVFPRADGSMQRADIRLEGVLRRALGRAGLVSGYTHVCRKKGCTHKEQAQDAEPRRCPVHGHLLWPKANVRRIRFHDLRHTTASLMLMAGASVAAVQRVLRHADPRITMEVYGHLLPGFLRDEVDRLSFGESKESQAEADPSQDLVTSLLQGAHDGATNEERAGEGPARFRGVTSARHTGFEPVAFSSGGLRGIVVGRGDTSQGTQDRTALALTVVRYAAAGDGRVVMAALRLAEAVLSDAVDGSRSEVG